MFAPQVCNMTANTVTLVVVCQIHGKAQTRVVDREAYRKWLAGDEYARDLFPHLTRSEVELFFVSGICGDCWDNLFG